MKERYVYSPCFLPCLRVCPVRCMRAGMGVGRAYWRFGCRVMPSVDKFAYTQASNATSCLSILPAAQKLL